MNFEIYCDESRPDLFTSKAQHKDRYLLIGGLWLPAEKRTEIKQNIKDIKNKHKMGGQIKWQKISNSRLKFYFELQDNKSTLLDFQSRGRDKWHILNSWLLREQHCLSD